MSFTNAPVTRTIVSGVILSSVLGSLLDLKHYLYILTDLHIWQYHQLWRVFVFQLGYTNSSEALFGAIAFYHMRTIERLWGSRKYASFLITSYLLTSLAVPTLLTLLISPLTAQKMTYLPAGPTPTLFAVLAQYHAIVPYIYQYRLVFPGNNNPQREQQQQSQLQSSQTELKALTFSDKSYKYILALQPLLFQFPASIPGAFAGWVLGHAHRYELLPPGLTHWRVPAWLVGHRPRVRGGGDGFEGLQRRLEDESAAATTATGASTGILAGEGVSGGSGSGSGTGAAGGRRRNWGQQILDQFRVVL